MPCTVFRHQKRMEAVGDCTCYTHLFLDQQSLETAHHEDPHSTRHSLLGTAKDRSPVAAAVCSLLHRYPAHEDIHAVFFDEAHHLDAP